MATNNDHEMTAAGTASPRDEDMRGDGAEPTIQEQLELDMELLRAEETSLPSALISVLARLVDANKALNEQNADLMAEVDAQRKEIARLEKGVKTPSRTIAYAPSMPTPNLDKFTGTQDPKSWVKALENLFKQTPMLRTTRQHGCPSHCPTAPLACVMHGKSGCFSTRLLGGTTPIGGVSLSSCVRRTVLRRAMLPSRLA